MITKAITLSLYPSYIALKCLGFVIIETLEFIEELRQP